MLVDIDDIIANDVDMALEKLYDIYIMKIDNMENRLKLWRDKIKNYGVKRDNVVYGESRKAIKKVVKIYPRGLLKSEYSISELDELRKYSWDMSQFGGMFQEGLRNSSVSYIIRILRCDDDELLENVLEIKNDCPCKSFSLVWEDIQKYLDLRIKLIKLKKLRRELIIEDDYKEKDYQKVLSKKKPEA